jgi:hypothetical protein
MTGLTWSPAKRAILPVSALFVCGSMVLADLLCAIFLREAQKNRTQLKKKVPY